MKTSVWKSIYCLFFIVTTSVSTKVCAQTWPVNKDTTKLKFTIEEAPEWTKLFVRDHGVAANTLEDGLDEATAVLEKLKAGGIDIDKITQQLEDEGIDKFNKPFQKLLDAIEAQKAKV